MTNNQLKAMRDLWRAVSLESKEFEAAQGRYTAGMREDGIAPCPKCGTFGDHYCPADVGVD